MPTGKRRRGVAIVSVQTTGLVSTVRLEARPFFLSCKEGIPIAIIGGLTAIQYGFERLTHDVDIVIVRQHVDTIIRVAPRYGIKVLWQDPKGWHPFECEGQRRDSPFLLSANL